MSCGAASGIVAEAPQPVLRVLPVERPEPRQQPAHVQAAGAVHVPRRVLFQAALQDVAQLARHHLRVDRVRHARRRAAVDQPQVAHVFEVAHVVPRLAAAQDRLDDPPHPLLFQLVRQLVEVRAAREDQFLPRRVDVVLPDGARAVAPRPVVEARPRAQRVHQPRLAPRLRPHRVERRRREPLARLGRVLRHQRPRLGLREVAQAQRLRGDVERAAARDDLARTRTDAVVADVAHAAQHDALREARRALLVIGAKLAQHREQGVAHQRVDLVDQQHQRRRVRFAPAGEERPKGVFRPRLRQHVRPDPVGIVVARLPRPRGQAAQDGAHAPLHVVTRHLRRFDVRAHAAEVAGLAAVEQVAQGDQGRRLARLPRRVQHEVALRPNQAQQLVEVHPAQRRNRVVVLRAHRPLGVEESHGPIMAPLGATTAGPPTAAVPRRSVRRAPTSTKRAAARRSSTPPRCGAPGPPERECGTAATTGSPRSR